MARQKQLKYTYTRTRGAEQTRHPRGREDYTAWHEGQEIGRVYWSVAQQAWVWTAWYDDGGPVEDSRNGWHADKIQACRDLERAYDAMVTADKK